MPSARILVVDDDPLTHMAVRAALKTRGYEILSAHDGQEGLDVAGRIIPDLLILDIMMPKLNGWSLIRILRTRPEFALSPVIFMTSRASAEDRLLGFKLGADAYLPKPVNYEELDLRVGNALLRRKHIESLIHPPDSRPAAADSPAALHGTLDQLGLPSLLTIFEMERKSGVLSLALTAENEKARIHLEEGRVVRARLEGKESPRNAELLYFLLSRTQGKFEFRPGAVPPGDEVGSATPQILLEGARRIDETQRRTRGA